MEQNVLRKRLWNTASIAGLALGGVSILYLVWSQLIINGNVHTEPTTTIKVFSILVWALKLVGCVLLMKFFMKRFFAAHPEANNKDTFRMGTVTALLSAFFYSAIMFIDMVYITPDLYTAQYEMAMQQYSSMMDSNSRSMMKNFIEILPQFQFVWTLLYCFVYGMILSAVLSRNIPGTDPFADYKPE
jgi:hypothetical protein